MRLIALDDQSAGLDDLGVLEAEDLAAVAIHARRGEADEEGRHDCDDAECAQDPLSHR